MENNQTIENTLMTIPRRLLVGVYLIVPLMLGVMLFDMYFLDWKLSPYLGVEAIYLPLFIFIFNFPHIIASFFSFFDSEYVRFYKKHLFVYLPLILLGTALLLYENYLLGLVVFLASDIWHGVKQKVGIALILGARPGMLHTLWTWTAFVTSTIAFIYIILGEEVFPDFFLPYLSPTLLLGALLILGSMILMMWQSAAKVRLYIFAVSMLFLVSYFFILNNYIFLSILVFRFVHDISAFAFYITHDQNRNREGNKNWLYSLFSIVPLPVIIMTPVLAFLFAYFVRYATDGIKIGYSIVILLSMCHYYLEAVMWKRGSPHRDRVRVE